MKKKIFIIFFVVLIINNKNIAKYIEKINIISETKIAKPIIEIENYEKIVITKIDLEKEIEYKFKVKNYNEDQVSNVRFLYYIEIESDISKELVEYKLIYLEENKEIELINNRTQNIKMLNEKYEKEYMLIAKLKEENLNGNINIKIGVVQNKWKRKCL